MNYDIIAGIARSTIPALIVLLIAWGIPELAANQMAGYIADAAAAIIWILVTLWTIHRNRESTQIKKVARMKGVKEIVLDPAKVSLPASALATFAHKIKLTSK